MPNDIHVLVPTDNGPLCALGYPTTPINTSGTLTGMSRVITLLSDRIEDLLDLPVAVGVDEVQRFDITGNPPPSKTFTLTFQGQTTTPIGGRAAAIEVETALTALSTIGPGNIIVTKDGTWGYVCTFQSDLGNQDVPQLSADDSNLNGTVTISTVTAGSAPVGAVQATSKVDHSGGVLIIIRDSTQTWVYRVMPAIDIDTIKMTFLGQLVTGTPNA